MKNLTVALFLLLTLATGCSKEESLENKNPDSGFFLKFKLDGKAVEYREIVLATATVIDTDNTVTIQGQKAMTADSPGLAVFITDEQPVTTKTYDDNNGGLFLRDDAINDYSSLFMTDPSGLKIVITQIDASTVRGTFTGKVADLNNAVKNVTEGEFYAKFQ